METLTHYFGVDSLSRAKSDLALRVVTATDELSSRLEFSRVFLKSMSVGVYKSARVQRRERDQHRSEQESRVRLKFLVCTV